MRPRQQYRMLQAAFILALVGVAFFGGYAGMHPYERAAKQAAQSHSADIKHSETLWGSMTHDPVAAATFILLLRNGGLGGCYFRALLDHL